jgi:hypothetical protein
MLSPTKKISAPYRPQLSISKRSFSEEYGRLPEVEYGGPCISFEMYQDNLAGKANAT